MRRAIVVGAVLLAIAAAVLALREPAAPAPPPEAGEGAPGEGPTLAVGSPEAASAFVNETEPRTPPPSRVESLRHRRPRPGATVVEIPEELLTVSGTVVDAATGAPVAAARITIPPPAQPGRTSADGTFEILVTRMPYVPDRSLPIDVELAHPAYEPRVVSLAPPGSRRVVDGLRLTMRRGVRVGGRVVDADGHPAFGVDVELLGPAPESTDGKRVLARTDTDEDGKFELPAVAAGAADTVVVVPQVDSLGVAVGGARLEGLDVTKDRDDLVVRLARAVDYEIVPVDRDGVEVDRVHAVLVGDEARRFRSGRMVVRGSAGTPLRVVVLAQRDLETHTEHLRGEGVASASDEDALSSNRTQRPIPTRVVVRPTKPRDQPREPIVGIWNPSRDGPHYHVLRVRAVDASTGSSLAAKRWRLQVHGSVSAGGWSPGPDGGVALPLGTTDVTVGACGYRPVPFRFEALESGESERVVRLEPLPLE